MSFDLRLSRRGSVSVVRLSGELDLGTSGEVASCVDRLVDQGHHTILVDLAGLVFCDSTGLAALVRGHHRCTARGGWLRVTGETGSVARTLRMTGLRDLLGHGATEGQAAARPA